MDRTRLYVVLVLALTLFSGSVSAVVDAPQLFAHGLPVVQGLSFDSHSPAKGQAVRIKSHGAGLSGQLYRSGGAGPHPAVVLLHGFPGDEQYLDLPSALQRAGWSVITFHYRGLSGSGGKFSFKSGLEDVGSLLDQLRQPNQAKAWGIDPKRVVVMGHSYGGLAAASAAKTRPWVLATALIAPWDISEDARTWATWSDAQRLKAFVGDVNSIDGQLESVTSTMLLDEVMRDGHSLDLAQFAAGLIPRPLLVITATRDDPDDQALGLLKMLKQGPAAHLTVVTMETDHGFGDHRLALETAVTAWLDKLAPAPSSRIATAALNYQFR